MVAPPDLTGIPELWPEPAFWRLRPKKRLGQHFLVNPGVLCRVLAAAEVGPTDCVVEVGPGTGSLTRGLLQQAGSVVAVELDRALAERLQTELGGQPTLHLIQGDILRLPVSTLVAPFATEEADGLSACPPYKVVANLPYNIAAPVLRYFLAGACRPTRMVVMIQYEVAKSIVAAPGQMSLLAVAVQFYGRPQLVAQVAPGSFLPPPRVRSAILRIDTYAAPPVDVASAEAFFATVRAGFSAPRKQLHNALAHAWQLSSEQAHDLLAAAGIEPERRAQTLALTEWARIAQARGASTA